MGKSLQNGMKDAVTQKRTSEEFRKRYDDTEDAFELKRKNFEKERIALQELITKERDTVKALKQQMKDSAEQHKQTSEEFQQRYDDAEIAFELKQKNFDMERDELQELVAAERNKVKALQQKLKGSLEKQEN